MLQIAAVLRFKIIIFIIIYIVAEIEESVLFTTKLSIRAVPLDSTGSRAVDAIKPVYGIKSSRRVRRTNFVAADYDASRQKLYYSDIYKAGIYSVSLVNNSKFKLMY